MGTGVVQVPPDSTGKKIDCASVSVSGATVYRQVVVIGDPTSSAGYATVTGGAVKVSGQVSLGPSTNNIGAVSLAAGTANIGFINNISAPVVLGAGTALIGAISNAAGTALMGAVSLAAGTANIGFINNISAPVVLGAGTALIGAVSNAAGTALMGAVSLAAGTANIGFINNISATVNVAGTVTIGALSTGTNNIGTVGISSGTLAMSGTLDGISATVVTMPFKLPAVPGTLNGPRTVALPTSAAVALIAAPGANLSIYVTGIVASNIHATQGTDFIVYDGANSASAVIATFLAPFSAPGASVFQFQYNPPWKVSANTALNAQMLASAYMTIHIHFYVGA